MDQRWCVRVRLGMSRSSQATADETRCREAILWYSQAILVCPDDVRPSASALSNHLSCFYAPPKGCFFLIIPLILVSFYSKLRYLVFLSIINLLFYKCSIFQFPDIHFITCIRANPSHGKVVHLKRLFDPPGLFFLSHVSVHFRFYSSSISPLFFLYNNPPINFF